MEFLVLPLLLLAGLFTLFDGSDGPNDDPDDASGNDSLTGTGMDTVFGGAGDDLLTLDGHAVGRGDSGNDTLMAQDAAIAYGLAGDDEIHLNSFAIGMGGDGDDSLTGSDNAVVMGGAGNDAVTASGSGEAHGGAGDDQLMLSDEGWGFAGEGNDTIRAEDNAAVMGGDGDDLFYKGGATTGQVTVSGGAGEDRFVLTELADQVEEARSAGSQHLVISDFDPTQDVLGVVFDPALRGNLTVITHYLADSDTTQVDVIQKYPGGEPPKLTVGEFLLRGVSHYDITSMRFYPDEAAATQDLSLEGGPGNDVLSNGDPIWGRAGDDQITSFGGNAYGESGNDNLSGEGSRLWGGAGDDQILAAGRSEAFGGAGNDRLRSLDYAGPDYGEEGDGPSTLYGGMGDDVLDLGGRSDGYGGAGNDHFLLRAEDRPYDGMSDALPRSYVLAVQAQGADGDDLFEDSAVGVDLASGNRLEMDGARRVVGGFGDDTAILHHGLRVDLGYGSDVLLVSTTDQAGNFGTGRATLGVGADRVAIKPTGVDSITEVLYDFNPAVDTLGLIVPAADSGRLTLSSIYDAASDSTVLTFDTGAGTAGDIITVRLERVSTPITGSMIQLYTDQAAALAGTAYRTL